MNSHRNETASRISFIHGLVAMPTYRSYWLQDWLYKNEFFPSVMARDRFTSIMWFANIKEELVSKDDCLRKIRFPINHRNTIVPEMFMPHKELLINESIMFDIGGWFSTNISKIKEISLGSNFSNSVPLMAWIYSGQKSLKTHSPLGEEELWFFI